MIIITLKFKKTLPEIYPYLEEHNIFLDIYFAKNIFIASGLLENKDGGIILMLSNSVQEAKDIIKNDPFYIHDLVDFEYTYFNASKLLPCLSLV